MALYVDESGRAISTHSMLKTFRRCPQQAFYKYELRLKPKVLGTPLRRGTWLHILLEEHHQGRDWRVKHRELSRQFANLLDEEREYYGDLPNDCARIMRSYEWHYEMDPWKVLETEGTLEAELPDGTILRGRYDALIENQFGIWLVDHKSHRRLPDTTFRLLDAQSADYLWLAAKNKLKIQGFIWNYLVTKPPTVPKMTLQGRLSKVKIDTDYPTYIAEVKRLKREEGLKITQEYIETANKLKSYQYRVGQPQLSSFFQRVVLEKSPEMVKRVVQEAYRTSKRMHNYDFTLPAERSVDRSCSWCSYKDLCTLELMGGNTKLLRKQQFTIGDPMEYYQDRAGEVPDAS